MPFETVFVPDSRTFKEMVISRINSNEISPGRTYRLRAALLYTEEDIELVKYFRANHDYIGRMSDPYCTIFVVEKPLESENKDGFWKSILSPEQINFWHSLRWDTTKPYDRASVYDIAKTIGVPSYNLPCLAFFMQLDDTNTVIIPMLDNYTEFFRRVFGLLEKELFRLFQSGLLDSNTDIHTVLISIKQQILSLPHDEQSHIFTDMLQQSSSTSHLLGLKVVYEKRLRILEKQDALYGASVDPRILIEIEDTKAKITEIQAKLNILEIGSGKDEA